MIAAQDNYEVDPPFREWLACVPVEDEATVSRLRFEKVEQLLRDTGHEIGS